MPEEELVTISARIQKSQAKTIEKLAFKKGVDKSTIVRQLLSEALQKQKIEEALEQVRKMRITVWKAAQTAGVSYREMLQLLKTHNIPFPLTQEELKREIEEITSSAKATN